MQHLSHKILWKKISTMSGTKLKKLFKQKYQCTITEYTQRSANEYGGITPTELYP